MFSLTLAAAGCLFLPLSFGSAIFKWPDPLLDQIDELLYGTSLIANLPFTCRARDNTTLPAQWVRLAYHDMATHNVDDGTGGLDGSIAYELDRPQNVGGGMLLSLQDFEFSPTAYVSFADIIAMGVVFSVAACGGPLIPFRAGRIDARAAGPETVPEPQQDLASHIESFRRQGFTQSEMIALVACGHSLGGVTQTDFPTIVPPETSFAPFASKVGFSNLVVHEYLNGSTVDPLVIGLNTTTNSDLRIFSSDNNATMTSLTTGSNFNDTCQNLLERMINTVPNGVALTEPVDPIPFKVAHVQLYPQNGTLVLNAKLRFLHLNPNRTVTMRWKEKTGSFCDSNDCSVQPLSDVFQSQTFLSDNTGIVLRGKAFQAQIDLNSSISQFWFEVNENNGSAPYNVDNNGEGYIVDDTVLFDNNRTTSILMPPFGWTIVVAVKGTPPPDTTHVSLEGHILTFQPPFAPNIVNVDMAPDPDIPPSNGYTYYIANLTDINGSGTTGVFVKAVVGGETHQFYVHLDDFGAS